MRLLWLSILIAILSATPLAAQESDFRMTVRDAFKITGRGVVVTGTVEGGPVNVDDVVCLRPADGEARELTVAGIEMFRRMLEVAEPGDAVGLLFEGIETSDVNEGDVLAASCA